MADFFQLYLSLALDILDLLNNDYFWIKFKMPSIVSPVNSSFFGRTKKNNVRNKDRNIFWHIIYN